MAQNSSAGSGPGALGSGGLFPAPAGLVRALLAGLAFALLAAGLSGAEAKNHSGNGRRLRADSRAPHYHCITLYDADGEAIAPDDEPAMPWSPEATCGKCHDVRAVASGFHFNPLSAKAHPGRPGEPWILIDPGAATQLALAAGPETHGFLPSRLQIGPWEFIRLFGRHSPGNIGPSSVRAEGRNQDPAARWDISGRLEIDCLACHIADGSYDPAARARQIDRQNFRWAPTACSGLAVVRGAAAKAPDDWDPAEPPDPDHPEQAGPRVAYDKTRFNADDRVYFPITGRPPADRCFFCHTVREVGPHALPAWQTDRDVHLSLGLTCVDCHQNGIDHAITRGCPAAASAGSAGAEAASLTCAGCHLGPGTRARRGGRHGAPYPYHAGLPGFHLRELSCTACHSGLRPTPWTRYVQTARAHALGLPREGRSDRALPRLVEPIFLQNAAGVITPNRGFWPAFFGVRRKNGAVDPLPLKQVDACLPRPKSKAKRDRPGKSGAWTPFTEKKLAAILAALGKKVNGTAVYVCAGRRYFLKAGKLVSEHGGRESELCAWPVAHDVRPAAQALGARDCLECHGRNAAFFFGTIRAEPAIENRPAEFARAGLMGVDPGLMRAWAVVLRFRALMLGIFGLSGLVICGVLFHHALLGLAALTAPPAADRDPQTGVPA